MRKIPRSLRRRGALRPATPWLPGTFLGTAATLPLARGPGATGVCRRRAFPRGPTAASLGGAHLDLRAGRETRLAVGDDALAGGEALGDDRLATLRALDRDAAAVHGGVGLHHEDVLLTLLAALHGLRRDDDRIRLRRQRQGHVDELARP